MTWTSTYRNPSEAEISKLLRRSHTIAVVGLSEDPARPSYGVAQELRGFGLDIFPVNPNLKAPVLGRRPYASLSELPVIPDIVDVFRRSEFAMETAIQAVGVGAPVLWMQLGIHSDQAAEYATQNGLAVITNRCLAVDYRRFIPR